MRGYEILKKEVGTLVDPYRFYMTEMGRNSDSLDISKLIAEDISSSPNDQTHDNDKNKQWQNTGGSISSYYVSAGRSE